MNGSQQTNGSAHGAWQHGPHSQFFRDAAEWENDPQASRYGHQLLRAKDGRNGLGFDAVLCVEGQPTVYFKTVEAKNPAKERDWHRAAWNQGTVTLLAVDDTKEVRVYSTLAKPEGDEISGSSDQRLVATLKWAADALELRQFVRSVETGEFYQRYADKFRIKRPVDQYLLGNLRAARNLLCDPKQPKPLDSDVAHAFLGRALFTCYLLEREIIGERQLKTVGAPVEKSLWRVLEKLVPDTSRTHTTKVLFDLFELLHEDFNGSMFSGKFAAEQREIRVDHLDVLCRFLRGDDLKNKQPALGFDLYDFRFIPIELISSIYESFLTTEDPKLDEAEDLETDPSKTERRQSGAYYTPPRLAELVVDIATKDWTTFLNKRCLDPACGSGVFLVVLFQRMAEEWRRKNRKCNNVERALALRQFLTENLCGVDRNETACLVACFSLYLAFMDQFDPPDIWALRDELARRHKSQKSAREEKVLPPLMPDTEEIAAGARTVIHAKNFFAPELDKFGPFHLIIGNPPWFGRQQASDIEMEKWLFSDRNPFLKDAPEKDSDRKAQFLPSDQSAIGFMWKAPLHARKGDEKSAGRICLLLPSRVFLANKTDKFQAAWFQQFRVEALWQLADYRFILFDGPDCPATIVRYLPHPPADERASLTYIVPKVQRSDPRQAAIFVLPEDDKLISQTEVIGEACRKQAFILWKKHFWGTPRDVRFIERLLNMPKLDDHAGRPGTKGKPWNKGAGFQPVSKSTTKPDKAVWKPKDWYLNASKEFPGLILLERDCERIGHRFDETHRTRKPEIYQPPLVIFNKGASKFFFADFPVYFQDAFQSIAGPKQDEDLLLLLTAVMQSDLVQYFLFHTTANIGVERDIARIEEFLRLPFPFPKHASKPAVAKEIARLAANLMRELKAKLESPTLRASPFFGSEREKLVAETKQKLSPLILDYYELNNRERVLLDDTLKVFLESSTPSSSDSDIPTLRPTRHEQRKTYADYFCSTINTWAHRTPEKLQAVGRVCPKSGLCLLTFTRVKQPNPYHESDAGAEFESVLKRIGDAAQEKYPGITYLRGFFLIEDNAIHMLKPLAYRHWTRTAALNDADEVVAELMFLKESS